ncbi:CPK2 [Symbiodinium pilosum]|uniref:CPK2 protein n=1 Tax=Symbiodinium pilosum TaxID=2952 RepID=A0A812RJT2_SYMPI|nr:CPK2 [Symbiodinium pilosum]
MAEKAVWEVIGGKDKGKEYKERLSFASLVEQVELVGKRLHYKLLTGSGPESGKAA